MEEENAASPRRIAPFVDLPGQRPSAALRDAITSRCRIAEPAALAPLLDEVRVDASTHQSVQALATRLTETLRQRTSAGGQGALAGLVQGLMQEYALSSQEGVALMCLAEALLRIPDSATRDALIRDKIQHGDWYPHIGHSPSMFVNAASWGLLLTGKLAATHSEQGLSAMLARLVARGGEPVIRRGVDVAMRLLGEQFVTGETIAEALRHAETLEERGYRYSFDMLGEAAMTDADAVRYRSAYELAIHAIGRQSQGRGVRDSNGISIKLSALHPRYRRAQYTRVMDELYPTLLDLAQLACHYDIGLNIDAEEAERLELSLDLLEKLCHEPALAGYQGIGFVVQAYQKRCPAVCDYLIDLARRSGHRLMVRLVKGAYWDSEIKQAQLDGLPDYPVYTRKSHTDIAYLACARRLLSAPDAVFPQFATHNAHTVSAIVHWAGPEAYTDGQYEFQCLHGMGEPLYDPIVSGALDHPRPCRIYAPVGTHETLLAYLVRRLLENGANTSFVNRVADSDVSIETLIEDPLLTATRQAQACGPSAPVGSPHPAVPAPPALYGEARDNSLGIDLSAEPALLQIEAALDAQRNAPQPALSEGVDSINPARQDDVVGRIREAAAEAIGQAVDNAVAAAGRWAATPAERRAQILARAADSLQRDMPQLMALMMREAGKVASNAVAEVREAIDFLRFYAAQTRADSDAGSALGAVVCISPWNFPVAIFTGQVSAALAAGNTVLAKPAEQTPLCAQAVVTHLHAAGVPDDVLQLLPGRGEVVGAALVEDPRVAAVLFTGSTAVARLLQASLAARPVTQSEPTPLIAETGGQNAMIVDSSALAEQVVADVVTSAFDSAGQRCSALRLLCLQSDIADRVLEMLHGAMSELRIGDPARLAVDVGPVIDEDAKRTIERHIAAMRAAGQRVYQSARREEGATAGGSFVLPTLIEIDDVARLEQEVFGPVLHVVRYRRAELGSLTQRINALGYALTFGIHTRIDETVAQLLAGVRAGNVYVNRNIVGAVVGVQPFGGEGLSGTGPKAGGPLYLHRLRKPDGQDVLSQVRRFCKSDLAKPGIDTVRAGEHGADKKGTTDRTERLKRFADWLSARDVSSGLKREAASHAVLPSPSIAVELRGPTGETNRYTIGPRECVLCLADDDESRLWQLLAVLHVDSQAAWPDTARSLWESLPDTIRARVRLLQDWRAPDSHIDAVLFDGDDAGMQRVAQALSERPGPVLQPRRTRAVAGGVPGDALIVERSISINTAAAGGNASLMTIG